MAEAALRDSRWFPDRLDWRNRLVRLVPVEARTLRESAFLDGRTPLHDDPGDARVVDLAAFVDAAGLPPDIGWIFHESFCGSTQLARLLTIEGHALCLREPQLLVDLANWRASLETSEEALFAATVRAAIAGFADAAPTGERLAIKPSNWANTIAADLLAASRNRRAVYLEIAVEPFLIAVLRGGPERVRYVLQLHMHLAAARPALREALSQYLESSADEAESLLRHLAATHWMQRRLRDEITMVASASEQLASLSFPDWLADPQGSAIYADRALALDIPPAPLENAIGAMHGVHSKTGDRTYRADSEEAANASLRAIHGEAIARALRLLEQM